jgi:hypothetical protein
MAVSIILISFSLTCFLPVTVISNYLYSFPNLNIHFVTVTFETSGNGHLVSSSMVDAFGTSCLIMS